MINERRKFNMNQKQILSIVSLAASVIGMGCNLVANLATDKKTETLLQELVAKEVNKQISKN